MASMASSTFFPGFIFLVLCLTVTSKKTYIVHMKHQDKPLSFETHHDWYSSSLQSLSATPAESLLYSYNTAFNGFAASLDPEQAEALSKSDSILGVYEDTVYNLHTTRTPQFLGLDSEFGLWEGHNTQQLEQASRDVIIGVLDTGIWPESKSFDDSGLPAIPSRWRGECESAPDFNPKLCNKKLIGARSFSKGFHMATGGGGIYKKPREVESPRDKDGHGTHTASTAAGSHVGNASLLGYASGTARGMATHARVAAYKVCWETGCFGSDILAGMDRAIQDGVDVLSMSLGGGSAPYYRDTIAIGAFTAMEKGIFVSCSAGNSGPSRASLANVAPWIMTVGAGTLDRDFPAYAVLGNKVRYNGVSLYSGQGMGNKPVGLVYSKDRSSSNLCLTGSLDPALVRGKVVICDRGTNAELKREQSCATQVGDLIREYARSDPNPTAALVFGGTVLYVKPSPIVAAFSSRGPNMVTPQILKPDVIGPGVNILAAWSEAIGPTGLAKDTRKTMFNIMSGTSMSCPHISGLAALIKAAHPEWSPSAIKSALMTTAYSQDNTNSSLHDAADGSFSNPWAHGAGHVDPQKALSPGLVYDISIEEYITFLCSLGYTIDHVKTIAKRPNITCLRKFNDPGELNYPSFSVLFGDKRVVRYTRELTNVGTARSVYRVTVNGPSTVGISVRPRTITFRTVGEKKRYTVTFVAKRGTSPMAKPEFGSIVWGNARNQVKSPVSFSWTELSD
ncbi:Subtilisin-like protease SBT1.7 [Hibiscus syriacus]|uniref:Subtilisin-like protease SBT1.7 n=1 Tax=Hibiscus syriacus TaxID=106335 RepID=A0A6A3B146_HIBSY|nr:Subtilisin-like protease SBT1.7 [Hibiscus syriacus]